MKIADIQLRQISAPLPMAFSGGTYQLQHRSALLCRVLTDEGLTAEVCVGNESAYSPYLKQLIRGPFKALLLGQDPVRIEAHWRAMLAYDTAYVDRASLMSAIAVVDVALWDLRGRIAGLPVWKLLGGHNPRVRTIGIGGYYETSRTQAGVREEVARYQAWGLGGIKLKVGALSLEEDAARVHSARAAGGDAFDIVVDSNRAWSAHDALTFARLIADCRPAWLEEPLHPRHMRRSLRDVRLQAASRIAAGQSEVSVFDAWELLAGGAVDVINVTYNRGGGVSGWAKLAAAASFADVRMATVGEPQVSMHLMAGIPNGTFVECYPDARRDPLWANLYLDRPDPVDGFITVPDTPGFGMRFDAACVEEYAVEPWC